jgi:hypothetical protein
MLRIIAGVVAVLFLGAGGFFLWTGTASREPAALASLPGPAMVPTSSGATDASAEAAPQASAATREQKRFARYDRDHDGKVAREEYLSSRRKAFARLDINHDGTVSFEEYSAKAIAKFGTADGDRSAALDRTEFATTRTVRKPGLRCPPQAAAVEES